MEASKATLGSDLTHSSGDRQKNTQQTELKEEMLPNCDFSAMDRLGLL